MASNLPVVAAYDPHIGKPEGLAWAISHGPSSFTNNQVNSDSLSSQQMQFTINPPDNCFLSPYIMVEMTMNFTASATTASIPPGQSVLNYGSTDSLRAYPLHSISNSLTATINNATLSYSPNQFIHEIGRYITQDSLKASSSPMELDRAQQYSDSFGTMFSPIAGYNSSTPANKMRGCYAVEATSTPWTVGAATFNAIQMKFREYLMLPPFMFNGAPHSQAMYAVDKLKLVFNFSDLSWAWSHCTDVGNVALLTFAGSFTAPALSTLTAITTATLYYETLAPNAVQAVDRKNLYPLWDRQAYSQNGSAIASGASAVLNSPVINLNVVPERIYVFVKKAQDVNFTQNDSDSYYRINSINIQLGNESTLLSGASFAQLYQMSSDNGLVDSFDEFKSRIGSVICLGFGDQIQLKPTAARGVTMKDTLQIRVNFTNIDSTGRKDTAVPTLSVVVETAGVLELFGPTGISNLGGVSQEQVIQTKEQPSTSFEDLMDLSGGAHRGGLGVGTLIKRATPIARKILDMADVAADTIGSGEKKGSALLGSGLALDDRAAGGRKMTKSELMRISKM